MVWLAGRTSTHLESLLVLLGLGMVDLLDGAYVLLEINDGMLPGLETFGQEASGLGVVSTRLFLELAMHLWARVVGESDLTLLGSVSGTASSLKVLIPVACLDGRSACCVAIFASLLLFI